jgi:transcriptional regulator with XRE-family HTH domain
VLSAAHFLTTLTIVKRTRTASSDGQPEIYDFRSLLLERFQAAGKRNARFSLRAFARQLGVNHSTLSQILRNRRPLSARSVQAIGKRLGLSDEAIGIYSRNTRRKPGCLSKELRGLKFDLDTFQLLTAWYHQAILELTNVSGFEADSRWISEILGIPSEEVNIALQRLLRLRLLEMSESNRWQDKSGDVEFQSSDLTDGAADQVNKEIHELAINAIRSVDRRSRIHSNMIVATDSRKVSELKILVDDLMGEARALFSNEDADDVYMLEISLFPLTSIKSKGEEKDD